MRVYSTGRFVSLLAASIIIALALVYSVTTLVPSINPSHGPGYTLSSTPSTLQVTPGATGSYTLKLTSQFGFSGLLKLAARVPNAPNSLAVNLAPSELQLSSGGSATTTLNVSTNPVTSAGTYSIAIDETSGLLSKTDTVNVTVVGFTVTADPTSLSFSPVSIAASSITVASVNGFSGQVSLFASSSASGPNVTISPNTIFLAQNQTTTSVLTVQSSAQGRFDVTVTATGNQFYQSVTLPITVASGISSSGDFSITTVPNSLAFNSGTTETARIGLVALNGCSCLVTLSTSGLGPFSVAISPYIVALQPNGTTTYSTLTLTADQSATPGSYSLTVTGTSLEISHSTVLTANVTTQPVADFTVTASPSYLRVQAGSSISTTITVSSVNGFQGSVSVYADVSPSYAGISWMVSPAGVNLPANGEAIVTLTISAASTGTFLPGYNFTVTAVYGTSFHSVIGAFVIVPSGAAMSAIQPGTIAPEPLPGFVTVLPATISAVLLGAILALLGMRPVRRIKRSHYYGWIFYHFFHGFFVALTGTLAIV